MYLLFLHSTTLYRWSLLHSAHSVDMFNIFLLQIQTGIICLLCSGICTLNLFFVFYIFLLQIQRMIVCYSVSGFFQVVFSDYVGIWKWGQAFPIGNYNSTWSNLIQWIGVMIVRWQSDSVNTKESVLPVCDKSYHTNKRILQKGEEIEVLRNNAFHEKWTDLSIMIIYNSTWSIFNPID